MGALGRGVQLLMLAKTTCCIALPLVLLFEYLGTFDHRCYDADSFFENHKHTRLFSTFLCFELVCTRCWLGYELQRVLALGKGEVTHPWAKADRLLWLGAAFFSLVVLDTGSIVWLWHVPGACDESARDEAEWQTISALCKHSVAVDMPIRVIHAISLPLAAVITVLVVMRVRDKH